MNSVLKLIIIAGILVTACKSDPPVPKPRGYYKFNFPASTSVNEFELKACDFSFSHPAYVEIEQDTLYFNERPDHPCWLNIKYPTLNGIVHMSYKPLPQNSFDELTEEYHRIKFKHAVKADFIDDAIITNDSKKVYGLVSEVGGNVASSYQFYVTDSQNHYVRGALYFKAQANADSLKPAVEFVKKDLVNMLESWKWLE